MRIDAITFVWDSMSQFAGWRFTRAGEQRTGVSHRFDELVLLFRKGFC